MIYSKEFAEVREKAVAQMTRVIDETKSTGIPAALVTICMMPLYLGEIINITGRVLWITLRSIFLLPIWAVFMWFDMQVSLFWFYSSLIKKISEKE